jgi:molybdenum cofactor biosynthesis protein B
VEGYRLLVSAAPQTKIPTAVNLLDYAGFRYDADLKARPVRWSDLKAAVEFANQQWNSISDGVTEGTREDKSGDVLEELLAADGYEVERRVVPDERDVIADAISEPAAGSPLVLTTGGTGLGPRDVTPEATLTVLERAAPGIAEAIRADSIAKTPHALLSRGIAGVVGTTLVVNLPGSPGGCRDGFAVLKPALGHALELLAGEQGGHKQT